MKKYEVKVWQATYEYCYVSVEAEDENEARDKAYTAATSYGTEWTLDDVDVTEIDILEETTNA